MCGTFSPTRTARKRNTTTTMRTWRTTGSPVLVKLEALVPDDYGEDTTIA
jgi:hypothetical protein